MFTYPGFAADFALVSWSMKKRIGRWSFWRRGTGERGLYHHCRGTEKNDPVDCDNTGAFIRWRCRGCGAAPNSEVLKLYRDRNWSRV